MVRRETESSETEKLAVYARHFVIKDLYQMNVCQCILLNSGFNDSGTRVELPITEHIPIIEDFPIFFSFLNQIK
jgi:hypothetical protein